MAAVLAGFDLLLMRAALAAPGRDTPNAAPSNESGRLRSRDPGAWRTLFEQEHAAIYAYAYSRLGSSADAEDVAAQVFEQAWRSASTIEDRGTPPRAWLFGVARHVIAEHHRRRFRHPPILELSAFDGKVDGVSAATDQLELARAVAALPRTDAEVITLRFLHGLSLHETAEAMNATVDAVKSRQARALQRLRSLLGEAPV